MIEELRDKVVLVTGGTGFVGWHLTQALANKGASVVIIARSTKPLQLSSGNNVTFIKADITRPLNVDLDRINFVFHLAAVTNLAYCKEHHEVAFRINSHGTRNVLEFSESVEAERFVYVSTLGIYGTPRYFPVDEQHPACPMEPYAQSKLEAEKNALEFISHHGMKISVARVFNVYGPNQNSDMVLPAIILQSLKKDVIDLENLDTTRDFIYIDDVVDGLIKVALLGKDREIYNLGTGVETSIGQLVNEVASLLEREIKVNQKSEKVLRVPRSQADVSKAEKHLGWVPKVSLRDGLRRIITFYRDEAK